MARITVEDCLKKIPNHFELVVVASHRAQQISAGGTPLIDDKDDKPGIIALKEIAEGVTTTEVLNDPIVQELPHEEELRDELSEIARLTEDDDDSEEGALSKDDEALKQAFEALARDVEGAGEDAFSATAAADDAADEAAAAKHAAAAEAADKEEKDAAASAAAKAKAKEDAEEAKEAKKEKAAAAAKKTASAAGDKKPAAAGKADKATASRKSADEKPSEKE